MNTNYYDIVIVGAGMAGATLAASLIDSGLNVAVLEGAAPQDVRADDPMDLRVSAITRASQQIFTAIQAWSGMVARRVSPFREMHVWDAGSDGIIHFDSADVGEDTLGHIIENRVVQIALWERLQQANNIALLSPAACMGLKRAHPRVEVQLADGSSVSAALVVGADGAQSRVRHFAAIPTHGWEYDQHAVVATVQPEYPHCETAWQRFLPSGPLAFLPLHDGRCSIVWSTTPVQATHLSMLDEQEFCGELAEAFDHKLGRILASGERVVFPLRLQHTEHYVAPNLALIGDAAHVIHPLAGQGVNLGILDAATLSEVLLEAHRAGKRIGELAVLRRYERWRKGDNIMMMAAMEGFKRLFGSEDRILRWLRGTGLALTDRAGPVKNLIIRHAVGRGIDLPRIARP